MRRLMVVAAAAALWTMPLSAQQAQNPETKPVPKTESKEAPSVAGKWSMTISTDQGSRQATLDLKLEGKKVTGSITSDQGEAAVQGEYTEGKLVFSITMQAGGGDLQIGFAGALKEDGSLAGTLDFGQGALNWTATRIKDK